MIILSALIILVIGITVVYAALSQNLNVTLSNITQNVASWNVGFEEGTIKGNKYNIASSSTGSISCGDATVTANSISVGEVKLTKPGDQCYWIVNIKNNGTIGAKLTSIQTTAPSEVNCTPVNTGFITCNNFKYHLYDPKPTKATTQGNTLRVGDSIESGGNIQFTLVAYIDSDQPISSTAITQKGIGFTLVWSQN